MISMIWMFSAMLRAFVCVLCVFSGKKALNRIARKVFAKDAE